MASTNSAGAPVGSSPTPDGGGGGSGTVPPGASGSASGEGSRNSEARANCAHGASAAEKGSGKPSRYPPLQELLLPAAHSLAAREKDLDEDDSEAYSDEDDKEEEDEDEYYDEWEEYYDDHLEEFSLDVDEGGKFHCDHKVKVNPGRCDKEARPPATPPQDDGNFLPIFKKGFFDSNKHTASSSSSSSPAAAAAVAGPVPVSVQQRSHADWSGGFPFKRGYLDRGKKAASVAPPKPPALSAAATQAGPLFAASLPNEGPLGQGWPGADHAVFVDTQPHYFVCPCGCGLQHRPTPNEAFTHPDTPCPCGCRVPYSKFELCVDSVDRMEGVDPPSYGDLLHLHQDTPAREPSLGVGAGVRSARANSPGQAAGGNGYDEEAMYAEERRRWEQKQERKEAREWLRRRKAAVVARAREERRQQRAAQRQADREQKAGPSSGSATIEVDRTVAYLQRQQEDQERQEQLRKLREAEEVPPLEDVEHIRRCPARELGKCPQQSGAVVLVTQKRMELTCTAGCDMRYHYECWQAVRKLVGGVPKLTEDAPCLTEGCSGTICRAVILQDKVITVLVEEVRRKVVKKKQDVPLGHAQQLCKKSKRKKGTGCAEEPQAAPDAPPGPHPGGVAAEGPPLDPRRRYSRTFRGAIRLEDPRVAGAAAAAQRGGTDPGPPEVAAADGADAAAAGRPPEAASTAGRSRDKVEEPAVAQGVRKAALDSGPAGAEGAPAVVDEDAILVPLKKWVEDEDADAIQKAAKAKKRKPKERRVILLTDFIAPSHGEVPSLWTDEVSGTWWLSDGDDSNIEEEHCYSDAETHLYQRSSGQEVLPPPHPRPGSQPLPSVAPAARAVAYPPLGRDSRADPSVPAHSDWGPLGEATPAAFRTEVVDHLGSYVVAEGEGPSQYLLVEDIDDDVDDSDLYLFLTAACNDLQLRRFPSHGIAVASFLWSEQALLVQDLCHGYSVKEGTGQISCRHFLRAVPPHDYFERLSFPPLHTEALEKGPAQAPPRGASGPGGTGVLPAWSWSLSGPAPSLPPSDPINAFLGNGYDGPHGPDAKVDSASSTPRASTPDAGGPHGTVAGAVDIHGGQVSAQDRDETARDQSAGLSERAALAGHESTAPQTLRRDFDDVSASLGSVESSDPGPTIVELVLMQGDFRKLQGSDGGPPECEHGALASESLRRSELSGTTSQVPEDNLLLGPSYGDSSSRASILAAVDEGCGPAGDEAASFPVYEGGSRHEGPSSAGLPEEVQSGEGVPTGWSLSGESQAAAGSVADSGSTDGGAGAVQTANEVASNGQAAAAADGPQQALTPLLLPLSVPRRFEFGQVLAATQETVKLYRAPPAFALPALQLVRVEQLRPRTCALFLFDIFEGCLHGYYVSRTSGVVEAEGLLMLADRVEFTKGTQFPTPLPRGHLEPVFPPGWFYRQQAELPMFLDATQVEILLLAFEEIASSEAELEGAGLHQSKPTATGPMPAGAAAMSGGSKPPLAVIAGELPGGMPPQAATATNAAPTEAAKPSVSTAPSAAPLEPATLAPTATSSTVLAAKHVSAQPFVFSATSAGPSQPAASAAAGSTAPSAKSTGHLRSVPDGSGGSRPATPLPAAPPKASSSAETDLESPVSGDAPGGSTQPPATDGAAALRGAAPGPHVSADRAALVPARCPDSPAGAAPAGSEAGPLPGSTRSSRPSSSLTQQTSVPEAVVGGEGSIPESTQPGNGSSAATSARDQITSSKEAEGDDGEKRPEVRPAAVVEGEDAFMAKFGLVSLPQASTLEPAKQEPPDVAPPAVPSSALLPPHEAPPSHVLAKAHPKPRLHLGAPVASPSPPPYLPSPANTPPPEGDATTASSCPPIPPQRVAVPPPPPFDASQGATSARPGGAAALADARAGPPPRAPLNPAPAPLPGPRQVAAAQTRPPVAPSGSGGAAVLQVYEVVSRMVHRVRTAPQAAAPCAGYLRPGALVAVAAQEGPWLQLVLSRPPPVGVGGPALWSLASAKGSVFLCQVAGPASKQALEAAMNCELLSQEEVAALAQRGAAAQGRPESPAAPLPPPPPFIAAATPFTPYAHRAAAAPSWHGEPAGGQQGPDPGAGAVARGLYQGDVGPVPPPAAPGAPGGAPVPPPPPPASVAALHVCNLCGVRPGDFLFVQCKHIGPCVPCYLNPSHSGKELCERNGCGMRIDPLLVKRIYR